MTIERFENIAGCRKIGSNRAIYFWRVWHLLRPCFLGLYDAFFKNHGLGKMGQRNISHFEMNLCSKTVYKMIVKRRFYQI